MAARQQQARTGRPVTLDHLKKKKPLERTLLIPASEEDAKQLADAREVLATANMVGDEKRMTSARAKLDEVEARVRADGIEFVFRGIGRRKYEELIREHPPTKEQVTEAEAEGSVMSFNPDTFIPVLLEATVVNTDLTAAQWESEVIDSDDWGQGEISTIIGYAMDVNRGTRVAELGN